MAGRIDLEDIFREHQRGIYGYLLRITNDSTLAEDLAQEVFLRAFRHAPGFRGDSSVRTWLFVIARSVLASHYRRGDGRGWVDDDPDQAVTVDPAARLGIEEALLSLPVSSREALVLCDLLGFDPTEAADLVGIAPNAFRVRLHRARTAFRKVYTS